MSQSTPQQSVVASAASHSVTKYELEVKAGKFLVLGRGDPDFIERARSVLRSSGATQVTGHGS